MPKLVAYYAHPISIYGTAQEQRDIDAIAALGFEVSNPNEPRHDVGYKMSGMGYFDSLVAESDLLVFRAFFDGSIPAGVAKEIGFALGAGKQVIELPCRIESRSLSVNETRAALRESGFR